MNPHNPRSVAVSRVRASAAIAVVMTTMALTANGMMRAAAPAVRLVGVATEASAVVIEATEPVAYTVNRADAQTLVVELRDVAVGDAASRVVPQGLVSGVRLEQGTAGDGVAVARIRVALSRAAEYTVKSARNTIRLELAPSSKSAAKPNSTPTTPVLPAVLTAAGQPANTNAAANAVVKTSGATQTGATRTQAMATSAAPRSQQTEVEAIAALKTVKPAPTQPVSSAPAIKVQGTQPQQIAAAAPAQTPPATVPPAAAPQQGQQIPVGQEKKYTGHPVSMDFQGVDLRSVLRTFAEISGLNMVIDPDVQGTVDIVLTDVPWDQALEVILRGNQLDYTVDGTIVRIAKIETLRKEQDARTQLAQSAAQAGTLSVKTYTLSYAKADQAAPLIRNAVLSPRGNVQIDARTNTLIITDLPERLDTVNQLLATLDRAEPQVEIEARIITTTREFARTLGVQWGFAGRANSTIGNTSSLSFPNNGAVGGALGPAGTAVNLGVGDATSAVGLALGAINGAFNLDVALSALERSGKGRILSTPRITTQNNVEAEITQGVQIPVQTVANETVTVTFKDAALTLKVTPQITAANTVIMQITVENASPGVLVAINDGTIPSIDTQRAITKVQVNDGMTTVMGGIFVSREQKTNDKTPALHRVPFLGWLFRRDSQIDESRELLIFITPRIQKG
jgi:type IV pilus assembly protein PilQ